MSTGSNKARVLQEEKPTWVHERGISRIKSFFSWLKNEDLETIQSWCGEAPYWFNAIQRCGLIDIDCALTKKGAEFISTTLVGEEEVIINTILVLGWGDDFEGILEKSRIAFLRNKYFYIFDANSEGDSNYYQALFLRDIGVINEPVLISQQLYLCEVFSETGISLARLIVPQVVDSSGADSINDNELSDDNRVTTYGESAYVDNRKFISLFGHKIMENNNSNNMENRYGDKNRIKSVEGPKGIDNSERTSNQTFNVKLSLSVAIGLTITLTVIYALRVFLSN